VVTGAANDGAAEGRSQTSTTSSSERGATRPMEPHWESVIDLATD